MSTNDGGRGSTISSDNRGPLLNITSWICMVAMSVMVGAKLASKIFAVRRLQWDDYFIASSMIVAILEAVLSNVQVAAGLGKHIEDVTDDEKIRLQKATYAAQIFYVAALYLARLGILGFLLLLAAEKWKRRIVYSVGVFALICGVSMELALIFQCSPPRTWAIFSNNCINQVSLWEGELVLSVLNDAILALLPAYLLYGVQVARNKKLYVTGTFVIRLVVVAPVVLRFKHTKTLSQSSDPSSDLFWTSLYTQIHMNLSIIVSCIPFLKPFTDNLQTGILAGDLRTMNRTNHDYGGYASRIKLRKLSNNVSSRSGASIDKGKWMAGSVLDATRSAKIESTSKRQAHDELGVRGTSEERLVIKQTVTVSVETEDRPPSNDR